MKYPIAAALTFTLVLFAALAQPAEVPFDQGQFDAARASGKPVAVVFPPINGARPAARKLRC